MTPEEQRMKRRGQDIRRKEWRVTVEKYAEFAAYIVSLKRKERQQSDESLLPWTERVIPQRKG